MAESELGVVSSQCLDRRIPDKQTPIEEVAAWEDDRNKNHAKADWQFTTANAHIKLKSLYPTLRTTQAISTAFPRNDTYRANLPLHVRLIAEPRRHE
jgi:hypothetical protein